MRPVMLPDEGCEKNSTALRGRRLHPSVLGIRLLGNMPLELHTLVKNPGDFDPFLCHPIQNHMTTDVKRPASCKKLFARFAQHWLGVIAKRIQSITQEFVVTPKLNVAPVLQRVVVYASNVPLGIGG